jgi:integrase
VPRVRFHDLRHSAASLLIAEGVELVEVSMLLGHSELRVTADLYFHL